MLSRFESSVVGSDGNSRGATMTNATSAKTEKTRNAPRKPNGEMSSAPMSGPPVKPASSTPRKRPKRSAARDLSMLAAIALMAGPLVPNAAPEMARARTNIHNELPNAKRVEPSEAKINAARTSFFGLPRSANGATNNETNSEAMNPAAAIKPRPASENPYLSCRSLSAGKIMLTDIGTLNPQISSGPMPIVNVASLPVFCVDVIVISQDKRELHH